ncbi:MAG TPA: YidC/Oxa1 family membrane protein insertase [Anaerolineae bacterium]
MWDLLIVNPMTNAMLWLYGVLGQNFVLAITVFTVIIRVVTLPLSLRQQRSSMRMQEMQPQIKAIQQKYKDNPQKMQEEFQKIGYNPAETLTGCLPLLIQMPILFGLFQVLRIVLASTPQSLFELTQRVYEGINLTQLLPINSDFLWMNLGQPDPYYVLPVLVFVTMFVQQKFLSPTAKKKDEDKDKKQQDDPTAAMTQSMQYTMPIMFGFFSLQFQAGLSIYFVLSNIIGIAQGLYMQRVVSAPPETKQKSEPAAPVAETATEAGLEDSPGKNGSKSDDESRPKRQRKRSQSKRKRRSAKR